MAVDKFSFEPSPLVCSQQIDIEIEDDRIKSLKFIGGCPGNLTGISRLATGMKVDDVIQNLEGILCDDKPTSCPDQLAQALKEYRKSHPAVING